MSIIAVKVVNITIGAQEQAVTDLKGFDFDFSIDNLYALTCINGKLHVIDENGNSAHVSATDSKQFHEHCHLEYKEPEGKFSGNRVVEFSIMKKNSNSQVANSIEASELIIMLYQSCDTEFDEVI